MIPSMDTQLLEAFIAVAESQSFSQAAEQIHLTQPAVSKRIALLEDQLSCRLFDRISRTVTLTEAGRALLPRAKLIIRGILEAQQAISDLSGDISGCLRLAISHHIGLHRLPPVLKTFTQQYPQVTLDVDFMDSEKAYEGILHGAFEVAVTTLAPDSHPKVFSRCIWPDPLVFMVAEQHPLTKIKKPTLETLIEYPAVLPGSGTYTGRLTKSLFDQHKLTLPSTMATNYLETIKMMVSIGLGWSLLPKSMLSQGLTHIPIQGVNRERQLGYIHHWERSLSNAARVFIQLLEDEANKKT